MSSLKFLFLLSGFVVCFTACSPGSENAVPQHRVKDSVAAKKTNYSDCKMLLAEARRMDSILLNETEPNPTSANAGIRAFADFVINCGRDSTAAIYLIKTAQVARAVNNIPQAKQALDRCIEDYRGFSGRPAAIFLLAQLYDENTYLNNEYEAQKLYEQILDEYPHSEWAASAKGALKFIGKSDAQIIKELKKKK